MTNPRSPDSLQLCLSLHSSEQLENHIQDLLTGYERLLSGSSTLSSLSSDLKDLQQSKDTLRKQDLQPHRTHPTRKCLNPSCNSSDLNEDVDGGSVVCFQCGMIRDSSVFENAGTDAVFHTGVSRIVVHRYSRIVVVRGVLRSLQGETQVLLKPEEVILLSSYFQKGENPQNARTIKRAIRILKLPKRLMYHATTILSQLWQNHTPSLSEFEIREVLLRFRALENAWDRAPLESLLRGGRKKFLSLPLVWKYLCEKLEFPALGSVMDELQIKNKRNREKQTIKLEQLMRLIEK